MRRLILLSLSLVVGVGLTACAGGSVLNSGGGTTPSRTIVTVSGSTNIARVLPGGGLAISAVQVSGSGNGIVLGNSYFWSAALTTGQQYVYNTLGQTKPCATVTVTTAGMTSPLTADFSIYVALDPVNESNIVFGPPTILPAPPGSTVTVNYPYCVVVTATPINGSAASAGSLVVAVVDPLNPLP